MERYVYRVRHAVAFKRECVEVEVCEVHIRHLV